MNMNLARWLEVPQNLTVEEVRAKAERPTGEVERQASLFGGSK